jgi:hypothetical protein
MASCVLPPIRTSSPPPPPVVTFFSVPRRYVKSNMQVGDDSSQPPTEDGRLGRNLRKSTRIQIPRSAPDTGDIQRTREEKQPTPTSPGVARKRNSSLDSDDNAEESVKSESPTDVKTPASGGSTGFGDLSQHVCLCQPEPKIPRPRNGESVILCLLSQRLGRLGRLVALPDSDIPICGQRSWPSLFAT